jgi:hypothetical protein
MFLDKLLMFDESDSVITASRASFNVIDTGAADLGKTEEMDVFVVVTQAFNNLTSLGIKLQTATDAAFTTPVDLPVSATPLLAALTLNSEQLRVTVPKGCLRYLRLYYTVTGTAPTTGTIRAGLIADRQTNS